MLPNGQFDPNSFHGACPVIKGTKWAANKWIWSSQQYASEKSFGLENSEL